MIEDNLLFQAKQYISEYKSAESELTQEDGRKLISTFIETSNLFFLPKDIHINSKINMVKKILGFSFELKTLYYKVNKIQDLIDIELYKKYYTDISPNPPINLIESNKKDRWVEKEGKKVICTDCKGIGHNLCKECRGIGKTTCKHCGGIGKITCRMCDGNCVTICNKCWGNRITFCPHCQATGEILCKKCFGAGEILCKKCFGAGVHTVYDRTKQQYNEILCSLCGGSGEIICSSCGGSLTENCLYCHGSGEVTCDSCEGAGEKICSNCDGTGKEICSNCSGIGNVICPNCDGAGKKICSNCLGYGSMMNAEIWEMETWIDTETYSSKIDIPKYVIQKLRGNKSYEKIFRNNSLPMIPNNKDEISLCNVSGIGFDVWEIKYSYNGNIYFLYKENGGYFHYNSYPKDWKKIGIIAMLLLSFLIIILMMILL